MQWILSVVFAVFLIVPGIELLRWVLVDYAGLYPELPLRDACLIILIVLQTATLVHVVMLQRELTSRQGQSDITAHTNVSPRPARAAGRTVPNTASRRPKRSSRAPSSSRSHRNR